MLGHVTRSTDIVRAAAHCSPLFKDRLRWTLQ